MEILSLDLKNFKIHQERHFDFQSGTNAISGENGAGKTSILEAIAWVLFDYNSGYNLADLIRNGAKSAEAKVTFISSQDGEVYQVCRSASKSTSGYKIFKTEPQMENLGLEKREDVLAWLKQHLGVSAETDLASLFRNTIGIPQGTFTHDFLKTAEERKRVFDPILGVEDYKLAFTLSSRLESYALGEINQLTQELIRLDESLKDWDELRQQQESLSQGIDRDTALLQQLQQKLQTVEAELEQLGLLATQLQQAQQQQQILQAKMEAQEKTLLEQQKAVQQAEAATRLLEQCRSEYDAYLQVGTELEHLQQQRITKSQLEQEWVRYQRAVDEVNQKLIRLDAQLDILKADQLEVATLTPLLPQQETLENQLEGLRQQLQQLEQAERDRQRLLQEQAQAQAELARLQAETTRIQKLGSSVAQIPELENQIHRCQEQLGRIGAAQQFEAELRHLVTIGREKGTAYTVEVQAIERVLQDIQTATPLFHSAVESALSVFASGVQLTETILSQLELILDDLSTQIDEQQIRQKLQGLQAELKTSQKHALDFSTLPDKTAQLDRVGSTLEQLQGTLQQLERQLSTRSDLVSQQQQLSLQLQTLNDPRSRKQQAERRLLGLPQLQADYEGEAQKREPLLKQVEAFEQQLLPFQALETQIQTVETKRKQYAVGYQQFLQQQNAAAALPQRQQELAVTLSQAQSLQQQLETLLQNQAELKQLYDPERVEQLKVDRETGKKQKDQLEATLPRDQRDLHHLNQRLQHYGELAEMRDRVLQEQRQKEQIHHFIKTAREVYSDAGPRVTRLFTKRISEEADRIFRELLDRQSTGLEWTEDYEIRLQEAGNWRSFKSLSGGEQMCAALAVRLALIRVLADIDIVFLDEPTTNMDETRRKLLAQAVANVTSFRQLFVISHDDTFETAADYVLFVEREVYSHTG